MFLFSSWKSAAPAPGPVIKTPAPVVAPTPSFDISYLEQRLESLVHQAIEKEGRQTPLPPLYMWSDPASAAKIALALNLAPIVLTVLHWVFGWLFRGMQSRWMRWYTLRYLFPMYVDPSEKDRFQLALFGTTVQARREIWFSNSYNIMFTNMADELVRGILKFYPGSWYTLLPFVSAETRRNRLRDILTASY